MLLLGGCGGVDLGGSSSSSSSSTSSESAPVVLDGGAIKGVIGQGQVTAWSLEKPPGSDAIELGSTVSKTVMTDSQGRFRLPIDKAADGWIMVELTAGNGTRMACDVMPECQIGDGKVVDFGESFPLGNDFRLRAAINLDTGNEVYLTPLSSLAVASAEQMQDGLTGVNLESSYQNMETSFGLKPGTLKLPPPDIVRLNGFKGSTDSVQLAVINAAFLSMVDGKQWHSIEEVLKASEAMIRRQGSLSAIDSSSAPAVRDLVETAAKQSAEIALQGDITDSSVLNALLESGDKNMAFANTIDGSRDFSAGNQVVDNTNTGADNVGGNYGDNGVDSNRGSGNDGISGTGGNGSNELVNIGGGGQINTDEVAADAARLSWSAPLTRVNGDSISMGELDGYEIVYGRNAEQLSESITIPENGEGTHQYTIDNLASGKWYFAIRVVDTDGLTSTLSDVISKSI